MNERTQSRWGTMLLAAGALLGAGLAGASLVSAGDGRAVPDDAVAVVDGRPILRAEYERALAAVAADRRDGRLTDDDRRRVLERLVDQELLVGRALELGLASRDRKVRNDLATAMIGVIEARADSAPEPAEAELRAWYADNRGRFATEPRVVVEHAYFRVGPGGDAEARERARAAAERGALDGTGDRFDLPVPEGPVPLAVLAQRLGPTVSRGVLTLDPGQTGGPWRSSRGYHVVRLVERLEGEPPAFEEILDRIRIEHRREAGERELERFLAERRAAADIAKVDVP